MKEVDPSLVAAGHQCGVDVEAIVKKYSSTGRGSEQPQQDNGQTCSASYNQARGGGHSSTLQPTNNNTNTDKLDRFRICKECHGYGLVKETYNFQVKDVNCEECDGERIVVDQSVKFK